MKLVTDLPGSDRYAAEAEELEQKIADTLLTGREERLMRLLFGSGNEDVGPLTEGVDVDTESVLYMLMLSVLGFRTGFRGFPQDMVPRLKGIHRYFQAQNVMGMPWLLSKLGLLRRAGIPVMLLKGIAMRYYYAPEIPRMMNDYDIAVPRERFGEAMKLLRGEDTENKGDVVWAETITAKTAGTKAELDVHRWIFKEMGDTDSGIWDRAVKISLRGADVLVPSAEDMFVHQLNIQARNYFFNELPGNRMKWLFDCRMIAMHEDFGGFGRVSELVREFGTEYTARLMLSFYGRVFGDEAALSAAHDIQKPDYGYVRWLRAGLRQKEEAVRFSEYGYEVTGPIDAKRFFRTLRMSFAEYRTYRVWPRKDRTKKTYLGYMLWQLDIDSVSKFMEKYRNRLPFLGGMKK